MIEPEIELPIIESSFENLSYISAESSSDFEAPNDEDFEDET